MRTQWFTDPFSYYDDTSTCRILFPCKDTAFELENSSCVFRVGNKTSIGNRSCLHIKAEWDVVPLAIKYEVQPFRSEKYNYMNFTTVGLPRTMWTALLANVDRILTFSRKYSRYKTEIYCTVSNMAPGTVTLTRELRTTYVNSPYDSVTISTVTYKSRGYPLSAVDVITHNRILTDGVWRENTYTSIIESQYLDVEYSPFRATASSLWTVHGSEFMWRCANLLPLKDWGALSQQCVSTGDKAYQTNSAQYLLELGQLSTLLSPYTELIRGGLSAKGAANAWLSYYYGSRLTAKDTYAQISGIIRNSQRNIMDYDVLRARDVNSVTLTDGTTISGYRSITSYYQVHSGWLVDTYRTMRRYGLEPSLSLAWDLVPLSFVVDWLIPIGKYLEHFDGKTFEDSLQIIESILTTKYVQKSRADLLGFSGVNGTINFSMYDRSITPRSIPRSTFSPEPISFTGMKVLNGTALAVQRRP